MNLEQMLSEVKWSTLGLRFTIFLDNPVSILDQNLWSMLTGVSPENISSQPRAGIVTEEGDYKNGRLITSRQVNRLDIQYIPHNSFSEVQEIANLGSLGDSLGDFDQIMSAFFSTYSAIPSLRLAIGLDLIQRVQSVSEGNNLLLKYLPFKIDMDNVSDFSYQVNRPRPTQTLVDDLEINRLSKWSILALQQGTLVLLVGTPRHTIEDPLYACRLELDINTSPKFAGRLQADQIESIYEEIIALGVEIAVRGDIP